MDGAQIMPRTKRKHKRDLSRRPKKQRMGRLYPTGAVIATTTNPIGKGGVRPVGLLTVAAAALMLPRRVPTNIAIEAEKLVDELFAKFDREEEAKEEEADHAKS
jgi:hypothetical protein